MASLHPTEESAILRAVIDETGNFLRDVFTNILWRRLAESDTSEEEKKEIFNLQKTLDFEPFASSDAAFLTLVVYGEHGTRGQKVVVPTSVKTLWDREGADRLPWLRQYVEAFEEIRNQCSQQIRGVGVLWEAKDLAVTLAKSDFSQEVQVALRNREYRFIR